MRPTTSSRVSAMSRISRPTSPVKARPTRGGVCRNPLRTSSEEASRRSRALKDKVSGPAQRRQRSSRSESQPPPPGRKVFDVDGLDRVVTAPVDREDGKAPQRPGHVVEQQVADPEDQRRSDDGVGDSETHQHILHLGLASEVGQPDLEETFVTEKWTILPTPALLAASNSVSCSRPRDRR